MKILLTGGTGFLGKVFLESWRQQHEVISVGRRQGNDIICDLSSEIPLLSNVDMVVHAAGLAHKVPVNKKEEAEFFNINTRGTSNFLKAVDNCSDLPGLFVFISTVSVYGLESGEAIDESFPLQATDAYGKSKIEAEKLITAWGSRHKIPVIILRLPLVSGNNPPGNLGAMITAISKGYYFRIGNGDARRTLVRASDVARLIPGLEMKPGTYNLASGHFTIKEIDTHFSKKLSVNIKVLSVTLARMMAIAGNLLPMIPFNSRRYKKLTHSLTFSDALARKELNWNPYRGFD